MRLHDATDYAKIRGGGGGGGGGEDMSEEESGRAVWSCIGG
jgi:hypothetical protein